MTKVCTIIVLSVVIVACSANKFLPADQQLTQMQQKVPGITVENARAGYKLYAGKCGGCHKLYRPDKYTIAQWNNILVKMFPKAKVSTDEQMKLIQNYLHAFSK
jgi:mono/diheme cytochrome c family protein